jgi:uncharacterized protein (DUF488 family)
VNRRREIFTVGHSTHPIERFLALLRGAEVETVADVRRYPGSRRNPQFGAEALAASLAEAGIGYESFSAGLGGRRSGGGRPSEEGASPSPDNSAWTNSSFRAYADHLGTAEFAAAREELERLADGSRAAVMCAEAHPSRCHRRLIADLLLTRGWRVRHLLADGSTEDHSLTPHAVFSGGQLSYPARTGTLRLPIGAEVQRR